MSGKASPPVWGRLGKIPGLLVECRAQAASYGRCVSSAAAGKEEMKRGFCLQEFEALKQCMTKAAKKNLK